MTDDSVTGYLARGWSLVALHGITPEGTCTCERAAACENAGKHPLYRNWQKVPIADIGVWQAIAHWRAARGLATNAGLATGRASGVFALDVDPKNGGLATLAAYVEAGRLLPATWEQRTGSGGLHLLFAMPADFEPTNATGRLGPGLDIRGTGGQIVLAPSVSDKGAYSLTRDVDPTPPPAWLLDDIRPAPYTPRAPAPQVTADTSRGAAYATRARDSVLLELAGEGSSRNSVAYRVACRLHELINAGWLDHDATLDGYLTAAEQASGLKPEPFGQHEALHVWENAERRTGGKSAELPPDTWGGERLDFPQALTGAPTSSPPESSTPPGFTFAEPGQAPPRMSSSGTSDEASAAAPSGLNLPPEFWAARPVLKHIQLAAHSRLVSADVLLHSVLVRLASLWPHKVRLETGMLSAASANLFTAVVGPSGAGKTAGVGIARRMLDRPYWLPHEAYADDRPLGSGEGMAEVFMGQKTVNKLDENNQPLMDTKGAIKTEKVRAQVRHNALLHADEGEVLAKMLERQGATVGVELRRAWSGGTIGQSNGRVETTRVIEEGSFSLGLVIGFQLNTVQRLLTADDATSGTTQRFLFCWALDPSVPRERLPDPGPLRNVWPDRPGSDPDLVWMADPAGTKETDLRPVTYAEAIRDELWEARHARVTTTTPEHEDMASQRPATLIKVSALLAYLDGGRRQVTDEDWRLAGMVWDTSCAVRDHAIALGRVAAGKAAELRRHQYAEQEGYAERRRIDVRSSDEDLLIAKAARWAAKRVIRYGPMNAGRFSHDVAGRHRDVLDDALEFALTAGWLSTDGITYSTGPVPPG
jgi:hypothetical protein